MLFEERARNDLNQKIFKEGIELWKKQQEFARLKKIKEQQEMRDLLDKYYPFGHATDMKPRGLRNLRLEGLFPIRDNEKAKRFVSTFDGTLNLGIGRPGGGAPMLSNTGKKIATTKEDPLLRFQFGSPDLRKCVDNTLRYKTNKKAQEDYKKELDKLVEEKRRMQERERAEEAESIKKQFLKTPPWGRRGPGGFAWRQPSAIGLNFFKSLGWSTEKTLKQLNRELNQTRDLKELKKDNPVFYPCKSIYCGSKTKKLSPLSNNGKENGIELVPILAKQRRFPSKNHLDTTDVTNQNKINLSHWNREGSGYLRELTQQMSSKLRKQKELKDLDYNDINHHFSTWDAFWGRPGHGAPKSAVKKQRLDRLLYPQMVPISVH